MQGDGARARSSSGREVPEQRVAPKPVALQIQAESPPFKDVADGSRATSRVTAWAWGQGLRVAVVDGSQG